MILTWGNKEESLFHCYFVHRKSQMDLTWIKPRHPRWETGV